MTRKVDPISTLAFLVFSVGTLIVLGIVNNVTLLPNSYAFTLTQDHGVGLSIAGLAVGIAYNGVNLEQINGVEVIIVLIGVFLTLAQHYIPTVAEYIAMADPYASVVLWFYGTAVYMILSYGKGVDWYPIGG